MLCFSIADKRSFVLAVSFKNGFIYILKSFDDLAPTHINTGLYGAVGFNMEWSNSRELLAVAGTCQDSMSKSSEPGVAPTFFVNLLKFYTQTGLLLYTITIPSHTSPVSAMTWGHSDKRLFIATGTQVHIAWVSRRVASLQLLCRLQIQKCIGTENALSILPLPSKIKSLIGHLYAQTIRVSKRTPIHMQVISCNNLDKYFSAVFRMRTHCVSLCLDRRSGHDSTAR